MADASKTSGFSADEKAAMKEAAAERRAQEKRSSCGSTTCPVLRWGSAAVGSSAGEWAGERSKPARSDSTVPASDC